jgi:hypothetical protein
VKRDTIVLILAIGSFVAVSFWLFISAPSLFVHFSLDSFKYDFLARNLHEIKSIPLEVMGYPFLLHVIYKAAGYSIGTVVFVQTVFSLFSLLLFLRIAKALGGQQTQIFMICFWIANLGFLVYSQLYLLEITLTLFYLLFIERIISYYERPSCIAIIGAALALGISILIRPAALFYAWCFVPFLLFVRKKTFFYRVGSSILFFIIFHFPVISYMVLNYKLFGMFALCPVMNVNLFLFFYPKLVLGLQQQGVSDRLTGVINNFIRLNDFSSDAQSVLFQLVLKYPFLTLKIWFLNILKTYFGLYQVEWKLFFDNGGQGVSFFSLGDSWLMNIKHYIMQGTDKVWLHMLGWYEIVYLLLEYIFAFIGTLFLFVKKKFWIGFFALSFVLYFGLVTGPDGSGRFRMMSEPWLLVLASLGGAWACARCDKNSNAFTKNMDERDII